MNGVRILVVDDDPRINELLQDALSIEGWKTLNVPNGEDVFQWIREDPPDLMVLDIMLPGISGIEVCRRVARVSSVPIIMLSGRTDLADKITCLNAGADDYITKPFVVEEFLAHAKAVLRRSKNGPPMSGSFDDTYLQIDFGARAVKVQGQEVRLTPIEYSFWRS